jgi:ubiquinone/menaquinone biosynthesis C-methylase UbiE
VTATDADRMTETVRRRYNRFAPLYDWFIERAPGGWWEMLWNRAEGQRILEVGVGTGRSFPFYPSGTEMTAVDFSPGMLARARAKARKYDVNVRLLEMDVQHLEFENNTFDTVAACFVFCSVPHPVLGLTEVKRVCKPGGKVLLLEHVISENRMTARVMNLFNPLAFWLIGDNVNRETVADVKESGLKVERVTDLSSAGIFKLIEARKVL